VLRRVLILALIVQQFVWLNLIVPGHVRGRYTLVADPAGHATARASCCSTEPAAPKHSRGESSTPTPTDRSHCAVCYFAVGTCAAPPVLCAPAPLGLLTLLDAPSPETAPSVHFPPAYFGRAPPAAV
jgi:hypothetical protein